MVGRSSAPSTIRVPTAAPEKIETRQSDVNAAILRGVSDQSRIPKKPDRTSHDRVKILYKRLQMKFDDLSADSRTLRIELDLALSKEAKLQGECNLILDQLLASTPSTSQFGLDESDPVYSSDEDDRFLPCVKSSRDESEPISPLPLDERILNEEDSDLEWDQSNVLGLKRQREDSEGAVASSSKRCRVEDVPP